MSKGPGRIEAAIIELFKSRRCALSVSDITRHAFGLDGTQPTRAQRLSATRAGHRILRRMAKDDVWSRESFGSWVRWERVGRGRFKAEDEFWRATMTKAGQLYFHPPDFPVRVWAVRIDWSGVHWFDAEVIRVTERNVMVRYADDVARLDRQQLWRWWAFWRGVRFVSSRTGRIAQALDDYWQERYGHAAGGAPPKMQMPLAEAMALLGVPRDYTREDVITRFRRAVKKAHPDVGGTAAMFRKLVDARDRLLAAIGTNAPPPEMPTYYPSGTHVVYRSGSSRSQRLGQTRRLAFG
jgi:hypothetical protein